MNLVATLTAAVACGVLGLVGGFLLARGDSAPRAVKPVTTSTGIPSSLAPRGLVCVRSSESEGLESDCESLRPALKWCEARLARCESRGMFRRHDWPDNTPGEHPERWTSSVRSALEACGIDLPLEVVDCTEYPCVAAVRPPPGIEVGTEDDEAQSYTAYRERLERQLDTCEPLQGQFGDGNSPGLARLHRYDVPCEGGAEPMLILSVLDSEGPAYAIQQGTNLTEQLRWSFRRGDDLAAAWSCEMAD